MVNDILLRSHLKRLRLPVIAQNYARISKEAAVNNQNYQDYLLALLEGEVLQRDENAQKQRLARDVDREKNIWPYYAV
jgi:DNA replication protein DnaC